MLFIMKVNETAKTANRNIKDIRWCLETLNSKKINLLYNWYSKMNKLICLL